MRQFRRDPCWVLAIPAPWGGGGGDSSERDSARSPFAGDGNSTLVPRHVADVGVSTNLAKVDGFLPEGSVETCKRRSRSGPVRTSQDQLVQPLQSQVPAQPRRLFPTASTGGTQTELMKSSSPANSGRRVRTYARASIQRREPEQAQLHKHLQGVFTQPGRQQVGPELVARPPIQERVHELAVVLAEARLVADVVELPCGDERTGSAGALQPAGRRAGSSPLSVSLR